MKMKKLATLASAIALSATLSANAMAKETIALVVSTLNNPFFVSMKDGAQQEANKLGYNLVVLDSQNNPAKELANVQDLMVRAPKLLLINPTDSVGVQSAVISAHKAGAVVVAIDAQAEGPLDSFVGSENYDAGFQAGEYLAKALGGKGKVAILDGIPVVPILERVRGFEAAMKKYPDIKIVTKQNGKQERDTALTVTENMLQSAPDLAGIFSVNDVGALGALAAIESNGAKVKLVSVDGQPEAIKEILKPNSPFIATSAQFPRDQLRIALGIALARYWGATVPKTVPVKVKLIDRSNAAGFSW
ncbi:substrate-binding domain-containing protein [Serratia marcescens]|uniref:substrate-binding domain-containing protein n=1 Tax=Serratia marcescens TaxID=615 RepID=UPI0013DF3129